MLTCPSILRSYHPLWNASAQNEGGVTRLCQFLRPTLPISRPILKIFVKVDPGHSEVNGL